MLQIDHYVSLRIVQKLSDFVSDLENNHWLFFKEFDNGVLIEASMYMDGENTENQARLFCPFRMCVYGVSAEATWKILHYFGRYRTTVETGIGPVKRCQTTNTFEKVQQRVRSGARAHSRWANFTPNGLSSLSVDLEYAAAQELLRRGRNGAPALECCSISTLQEESERMARWMNRVIKDDFEQAISRTKRQNGLGSRKSAIEALLEDQYVYADGTFTDEVPYFSLAPFKFMGIKVELPIELNASLPVAVIFDDKRFGQGLEMNVTSEFCLTYGFEKLVLNHDLREWVEQNGTAIPTSPGTVFIKPHRLAKVHESAVVFHGV